MARFRKKPVVIEAVKWNGCTVGLTNGGVPMETERLELPAWLPTCSETLPTEALTRAATKPGEVRRHDDWLYIGTLEGVMAAAPGDWIIRGVAGEIYPCKPEIFEATYEPAVGHDWWGAGDPECPKDIKAGNGELHTMRCKRCGLDNPRDKACHT
jgi:hypothetical protein